jgi:hypothetical protein
MEPMMIGVVDLWVPLEDGLGLGEGLGEGLVMGFGLELIGGVDKGRLERGVEEEMRGDEVDEEGGTTGGEGQVAKSVAVGVDRVKVTIVVEVPGIGTTAVEPGTTVVAEKTNGVEPGLHSILLASPIACLRLREMTARHVVENEVTV